MLLFRVAVAEVAQQRGKIHLSHGSVLLSLFGGMIIPPKIGMLCFVIINSGPFNLFCVWIVY